MILQPPGEGDTDSPGAEPVTEPETPRRSVAYRLVAAGGRFRWIENRTEVASAVWRDHCWDVRGGPDDRALLSLVGGSVGGSTRVALVDHITRRAATFAAGEPMSRSHIGVVRDSSDGVLMVVRADGPTGLHVINPVGELLALSSRRRPPESHGCDILLTPAGGADGGALMFGVTLALELLRAGALRRVA